MNSLSRLKKPPGPGEWFMWMPSVGDALLEFLNNLGVFQPLIWCIPMAIDLPPTSRCQGYFSLVFQHPDRPFGALKDAG